MFKNLIRDNIEFLNVLFRRLIVFLLIIDHVENEKTITNRIFLSIKFIVNLKSKNELLFKKIKFFLLLKYDLISTKIHFCTFK